MNPTLSFIQPDIQSSYQGSPFQMKTHISRRSFVRQSSALATVLAMPTILPRSVFGANNKLNIATIGALGKGQSDTHNVADLHNIVALVDADMNRAQGAAKSLAKFYEDRKSDTKVEAKLFTDFRKMFDEMHAGIDAVIVSTPDHTHFPAAMWAVRHKKHVAVQKPMCNYIGEIRALHKAAKEAGVVTQMGNQGRTMDGQRMAKEWVEQGAIGTLKEIRLWTNRPIWPQGPLHKHTAPTPEGLDWNSWLGQEVEEPYFTFDTGDHAEEKADAKKKSRRGNSVHPFNWRGWWAYGSGALGDMGCHIMDATFNILGRRVPVKIDAESSPVSDLTAPAWSKLVYHFAASDTLPALTVSWHDGNKDGSQNKPERDERVPEELFKKASSGMMFIGTEATIFEAEAYCSNPLIFSEERRKDVEAMMKSGKIKQTEARSKHAGNPQKEWSQAIVEGYLPSSNFDYSAPLTEFVMLGNLAIRSGQSVNWDAAAGRVTNIESANKFVNRPAYRKGWE